jgi:hypothetical protein
VEFEEPCWNGAAVEKLSVALAWCYMSKSKV